MFWEWRYSSASNVSAEMKAAASVEKRCIRARCTLRSPPPHICSTSNSLSCVWNAQCNSMMNGWLITESSPRSTSACCTILAEVTGLALPRLRMAFIANCSPESARVTVTTLPKPPCPRVGPTWKQVAPACIMRSCRSLPARSRARGDWVPCNLARMSALLPTITPECALSSGSASCCSNMPAISTCPLRHAHPRGVMPAASRAFTCAPDCTSTRHVPHSP
mmetsp:Transcript_23881/g.51509  ORF Transcript_23881/g.51509 Transcript_23881/m.51509 type:complete len:221 (+) Transcript_23881:664-1326(+)